jgi:hypothetical protein
MPAGARSQAQRAVARVTSREEYCQLLWYGLAVPPKKE